jgi:hypothetical protein
MCRSASAASWKKEAVPVTNDIPTVFAIGL